MEDKIAKILVVDDEPDIVNTLKELLSLKGYTVIGALSGEEALNILEKEIANLILLDIRMPGLKGTQVAKIIKEKYPSVKVIILTGYPNEVEDLSKDNFVEGIFMKPVKMGELYDRLSEILSPKEELVLDLKYKEAIKARVIIIKAKLLFLEPSLEIYNYLSSHFKNLSGRGENYELEVISKEEQILEKLESFNPDLLIISASFLKDYNTTILPRILDRNLSFKEIIVYSIKDPKALQKSELDKLAKAVLTACLKNGLIEISWVEI